METYKLCEAQKKIHDDKMLSAFWEELLENGSPMFNEEIDIKIKNYGLSLDMTVPYIIIVFSVKDGGAMTLRNEENLIHCIFRWNNTGFFRISQKITGIVVPMDRKMEIADVAMQCDEYIRFMYEVWERKVLVLIGKPLYMDKLTAHFNSILKMERQIAGTQPKIYMYESVDMQPEVYERPNFELWKILLERGLFDRAMEDITACLVSWDNVKQSLLTHFLQEFDRMMYLLETRRLTLIHQNLCCCKDGRNRSGGGKTPLELYEGRCDSVDSALRYIGYEIQNVKNSAMVVSGGGEDAVESVCAYIQSHMDESISRKKLAQYVHLNEDYLGKLFRKHKGISLKDYILKEKMFFAKELLEKNAMSVSEVALCTGFQNFSYFSTVFKKINGFSPGYFLNESKKMSEN